VNFSGKRTAEDAADHEPREERDDLPGSPAAGRPDPGPSIDILGGAASDDDTPAPTARQPADDDSHLAGAFETALADYSIDSASLRSRVLTGTAAASREIAAGKRPPDPARRRARTRPHSTRPGGGRPGGVPSKRSHRTGGARPRLVTVGALAAVVGVIGVSATIAGVMENGAKPSVSVSPTARGPSTPSVVSPADPATTDGTVTTASASESALPSSTGTGGGPGRRGGAPPTQTPGTGAARAWSVDPVPSGSDLVLPDQGAADWMIFGDGYTFVRATVPFPLIDSTRLVGVGSVQRDYSTSESWTWGSPWLTGSHYSSRLRIPGNRTATLTSFRGPYAGKLMLYVGGTAQLRVTVAASGLQSSVFTVTPPSTTAVITIDLGGLPYWTPATISVTGADGNSFSLASAVLH
jgi:hypothetical protein